MRVGGILAHSHSIREATKENWQQLHQFDLFPVGTSLWIEDNRRRPFSLTDGLPVEVAWHSVAEGATVSRSWFMGGYRKTGEEIGSVALYREALDQMRWAFEKRSRWAFRLEGEIAGEAARLNPGVRPIPIDVSADRA